MRWFFQATLDADDESNVKKMNDLQPISMEKVLEDLMSVNSDPNFTKDRSLRSYPEKTTTKQLENLVAKLESIVVDSEGPDALAQQDGDSPFLDPEIYVNYRTNINTDGSLSPSGKDIIPSKPEFSSDEVKMKDFTISTPDLPASYYTSSTTSKADATLLENLIQKKPRSVNDQDENLHKEIMAEEGGFEMQSKTFLEYLQNGTSESGEKASSLIRQEHEREEKEKIFLNLEKEMKELQLSLDRKKQDKDLKVMVCSSCNLPLTQFEIDSGKEESMCQICYAKDVVAHSDMSFLDDSTVEDRTPFLRAKSYSNQKLKSIRSTSKVENPTHDQVTAQNPNIDKSSFSSSMTASKLGIDVKQLKVRVAVFQQQLQKYKKQVIELQRERKEVMEENIQLRTKILQLENDLLQERERVKADVRNDGDIAGSWLEVKDPDTGDLFFWNEETDEMKWEM